MMAPAMEGDETPSDWANERKLSAVLKRHYSEPVHHLNATSVDASLSPSSSDHHQQIKCLWCSKHFDASGKGAKMAYDALDKHLAVEHPQIAHLSSFDGASDDIVDEAIEADDEVNDNESPLDTNNAVVPTATATDIDDLTPEADSRTSDAVLETDAAVDFPSKLHNVSPRQAHAFAESRLASYWNVHDACQFSKDYDNEIANLEQMWDHVYHQSKAADKNGTNHIPPRPNPYLDSKTEKGAFLKMTAVEDYLESLKDFETMPTDELHAAAANVAHALKTWQDEWLAIEKLGKTVNGRTMKKSANPRALDPPEVFQDKKEASLYGYKYDPTIHDPKKRDAKRDFLFRSQDPFIQGGFKPTTAQLRKMQAEIGNNNLNPDGFKPMHKFGQEWIPRFQDPPLHLFEGGSTSRKRRVPQSEVAALKQMSGNDSATPAVESDIEGRPTKRVTRSIAGKVLDPPQVKTAPPSPGPRGRGRGARAGRARGGLSKTSQPVQNNAHIVSSGVNAEELQAENIVPKKLEASLTPSRAVTETPPSQSPAPSLPSMAGGSGPTVMAPAPKPALAPATPGAPPAMAALPPNLVQPGEVVDSNELNRRRLLAKSKNPRRTQAMLDHWERFNKEGRTRNPKRTKAQIEADKRAEADRKAKEPPKEVTKPRKRKPASIISANGPLTKQARTNTSAAATVSIHPAPIQPAVAPAPAPAAPTSAPISLPPSYPAPAAPSAPQSPQRLPLPQTTAPQPSQTAHNPPPVLPGFDRNTNYPGWRAPPPWVHTFRHGMPQLPPYGRPHFPPPHGHPPHHHEAGPSAEPIQMKPAYTYEPARVLPHIHNGPHIQQPRSDRR